MERVNPSVKTILFILLGLVLSFNYKISANAAVLAVGVVLLCFSKVDLKKAVAIGGAALLIALSLFFTSVLFGRGSGGAEQGGDFLVAAASSGSLYSGAQLATRILAFAVIGILFAFTTDSDLLVASYIHQLKVPPKYAYGVLAAYHFSGNIGREFQKVRLAFQVRGIRTGIFSVKPLFVMLVNALHWSGDIAAAMESKGFDGSRDRTYHLVPRLSAWDVVFAAGVLVLTALTVLVNFLPGFR